VARSLHVKITRVDYRFIAEIWLTNSPARDIAKQPTLEITLMASSEILLIAVISGLLAVYGPKFDV
jgi:hypothetical protein